MDEQEIIKRIQSRVQEDLPTMPDHLREWAEAHLCTPHVVTLSLDSDGHASVDLWLVTDDTGVNDSSYRVTYDPDRDAFGLSMLLANGVDWYMGPYWGGFATIVNAM